MAPQALRALLAATALGLGLALEPQPEAFPDAEVAEALGLDETCSTDDDSLQCALNALQLKAKKLDAEAAEGELGACTSGMVGAIRKLAPSCVDSCPKACPMLGKAVTAYMTKGGQPAAKRVVCDNQSTFACFLQPSVIGKCTKLFHTAAGLGLRLPTSSWSLMSECSHRP
mmetsp:Transcript_2086/g.6320  ORF Transcript_2086/g.6320 Transcript_2086/m.6320 type:complete len:171 (-) Transcript_2086:237-749(-)